MEKFKIGDKVKCVGGNATIYTVIDVTRDNKLVKVENGSGSSWWNGSGFFLLVEPKKSEPSKEDEYPLTFMDLEQGKEYEVSRGKLKCYLSREGALKVVGFTYNTLRQSDRFKEIKKKLTFDDIRKAIASGGDWQLQHENGNISFIVGFEPSGTYVVLDDKGIIHTRSEINIKNDKLEEWKK